MLTEICANIKNYFVKDEDKFIGDYRISNGSLIPPVALQDGQYYRIVGSVFNDGVHRSDDVLNDEDTFHGAIWLMRVPKDVIDLAEELEAWQAKYGGVDSVNLSPYQSESFGGYNYAKSSGNGSNGSGAVTVWDVYKARLDRYRRIRV